MPKNTCISCGKGMIPLRESKWGPLVRCESCGIARFAVMPSARELAGYYDTFYDEGAGERFSKPIEWMIALLRQLRVRAVESFAGAANGRHLLDVGYGRVIDLRVFQRRGWTVHGTQVSRPAYEHAKSLGFDVFFGDLSAARYPSRHFDVVTLWHVLEHLPDPVTYLKEIKRVLKTGGALVIEVPNRDGLVARWAGKWWFGQDLPRHLHHFTPKALRLLLERNGFRVERVSFFSLEHSTFSMLQSFINVLTWRRNVVFESMKKDGTGRRKQSLALAGVCALLMAALVVPALILSVMFGFFGKGDVMRFSCAKR